MQSSNYAIVELLQALASFELVTETSLCLQIIKNDLLVLPVDGSGDIELDFNAIN